MQAVPSVREQLGGVGSGDGGSHAVLTGPVSPQIGCVHVVLELHFPAMQL
jgi:hypothetical protein